jgi:hypothetical protein
LDALAAPAFAESGRLIVVPQPIPALPSESLQPPSPSGGETAGKNQQKTTATQQPSSDNKRGTKEAPVIVEMANPPNGDAIAAEIKKNRDDQTAESGRSFIFNSLLVAIGFL